MFISLSGGGDKIERGEKSLIWEKSKYFSQALDKTLKSCCTTFQENMTEQNFKATIIIKIQQLQHKEEK